MGSPALTPEDRGHLAGAGKLPMLPMLLALLAGGCASGAGPSGAAAAEGQVGGLAFLQQAFARGGDPEVDGDDQDGEPGTAPAARTPRGSPPELRFVERALHRRGLRFGTDGTFGSLLSYLEWSHQLVPAEHTRRGDVVFFDIEGRRCADHAGVVESVDDSGRIAFRESRGGAQRLSYVHPQLRAARRSVDGRILNSFLRARRPDDPPGARYFAGEMLCAVGRPRR
jgi:hypothetical protein